MRLSRRELASLGILSLSGCLGQRFRSEEKIEGPPNWKTYGHGVKHQSAYGSGSIPKESPSSYQSIRLSGSLATSPISDGSHVIVGDDRGLLITSLKKGKLSKRANVPGSIAATPCVNSGIIYVPSDKRNSEEDSAFVSALTTNGEMKWKRKFNANTVKSPTYKDGTVYVRSSHGYHALESSSGKRRWEVRGASKIEKGDFLGFENFSPAIGPDEIIFPDPGGLTAVEITDGSIRWRKNLRMVRSCPVIMKDSVYVSDVKTGVHAFDRQSGKAKWTWEGTSCWSPPAISADRVYATEGSDIIALAHSSGEFQWRTQKHGLHGGVQSGISIVGKQILASSSGTGLISVQLEDKSTNINTGATRWMVGQAGFNTPIVVENRILYIEYNSEGISLRVLK